MSEGKALHFHLVKSIAMVGIQIIIVYINWFILFPYFFQQKKYILYGIFSILLVYFLFIVSFTSIEWTLKSFHYFFISVPVIDFPPIKFYYSFWGFLSSSAPYSLSLVGSLALKIYQENKKNQSVAQDLKIQQAKTEVQYLRAQINPHLLFNSLNNIHTLILKEPKQAATYTILLSELLRYMLYEVKKEKTDLKNEIKGLKNYFDLVGMKMENSEKKKVQINIENNDVSIVPLLLVSLIENGVKHSGIEFDSKAWLELEIKESKKVLQLHLKNSIAKQRNTNQEKGIGLDNLKKRLALNYPNQHEFLFKIENKIAFTQLKLNLDK